MSDPETRVSYLFAPHAAAMRVRPAAAAAVQWRREGGGGGGGGQGGTFAPGGTFHGAAF